MAPFFWTVDKLFVPNICSGSSSWQHARYVGRQPGSSSCIYLLVYHNIIGFSSDTYMPHTTGQPGLATLKAMHPCFAKSKLFKNCFFPYTIQQRNALPSGLVICTDFTNTSLQIHCNPPLLGTAMLPVAFENK